MLDFPLSAYPKSKNFRHIMLHRLLLNQSFIVLYFYILTLLQQGNCAGTRSQKRRRPDSHFVLLECKPLRSVDNIPFALSSAHYTFTREVCGSSLIPTGSKSCLSQSTRGQVPNCPEMCFWYMSARPVGDNM